jgi:PHP family Zn ribbon phosphoesterase
VLSTEVHCAPPGTGELQGIHHLIYFPSFAALRAVQKRLDRFGDLNEGRPVVRLSSRELLEVALEGGCHFAPAHVMNPYFSSLGSRERHHTLEEIFGELTPRLIATEMGLTSIPPMVRRIASLDAHALFACSDAHSPENIGRECTLLETEPGYDAMFAALNRGTRDEVLYCLKYSIHRTRYFLNWCARCETAYDGASCPRGHGRLPTGSRDWLEQIASREEPVDLPHTPPFRMYVPLRQLLGEFLQVGPKASKLARVQEALLERVGHERYILTRATREELAAGWSDELAGALVEQRSVNFATPITVKPMGEQAELSF